MAKRIPWRGQWEGSNPTWAEAMLEPDPEPYEGVVLERVYVLLDEVSCEIKIGHTATGDVDGRKRAHERARGRTLELVGVLKGGGALESALHCRFRPWRTCGDGKRGEWYSTEIAAEVFALLHNDVPAAA